MVHGFRCKLSLLCWHHANRNWHGVNGRLDARGPGHWPQHVGFKRTAYRHMWLITIVEYVDSPVLLLVQVSYSYFTNHRWTYDYNPFQSSLAEAGPSCSMPHTPTLVTMSIVTTFLHVLLLLSNFAAPTRAAPTPLSTTKRNTLSGSPVVFGAGTYPRATRLSDGSLLGVYTAFSGGNNVITTTRSTDNGASWQTFGEVTSGPSNANDIDNPYVLQLPDATGRVLCAFRNHSKDPSNGVYTYFRITVAYSDDKGKTWKYLSTASQDPGPFGNWEPFLRLAKDGSLQIYYSRENSAADQDTIERFSTDGGRTWTSPTTISGTGIISRDGMTGVADVSGSNVMAVFESETNGIFNIV